MTDLLIQTLEDTEIGGVWEQGALPEKKAYPDKFFTFWNTDTFGTRYYNNEEGAVVWQFEVNFYTNDRRTLVSDMKTMVESLKIAGFIVSGKGHAVASDQHTHTGRGIAVQYIESEV